MTLAELPRVCFTKKKLIGEVEMDGIELVTFGETSEKAIQNFKEAYKFLKLGDDKK